MIHQIGTLSLLRSTRHLNFGIPSAFVIRISSFLNLPRFGARQSLCPAGTELFSRGGFHVGNEAAIRLPLPRNLLLIFPETDRPSCKISGAESRRFRNLGAHEPNTEQGGLALHQEIVSTS